jgi:hypothetical protein
MPDEFALARGWFLKAESDLNTAKLMATDRTTRHASTLNRQRRST